jgi:phosphatidate cytidylyltransferase
MFKRTITGIFFLIVMVSLIIFDQLSVILLFSFLTLLGMVEYFKIASASKLKPQKITGIAGGTFTYLILAFYFQYQNPKWLPLIMIPVVLVLFIELYRKQGIALQNIAVTIFPLAYISLPFSILSYFANFNIAYSFGKYDYWLILGFFILIWANDTGAYLTGTFLGKNKLFPKHSPKKTWEGFIGGILFALISAFLLSKTSDIIPWHSWMIVSIIISVCGTMGDLIESMFKRNASIKDSGKLLPGHGGILDRFDAVFTAAPIVWVYLSLNS